MRFPPKGYIIQKQQDKVTADKDSDKLLTLDHVL